MFRIPVLVPTLTLALTSLINGQSNDNLGVGNGFIDYKAGQISGQIVRDSQTLASLQSSSGFDFLPSDFLSNLTINGAHHLGDVTFRFKVASASNWTDVDSASKRSAVKALDGLAPGVIAGADLAPTLPSGVPLTVTREWLTEGEGLALRVNLTNNANTTVELGSLGLPVVINNIFETRSAEDIQAKCSLADPYIGLDAGYVRVSPVKGLGNALVVAPLGKSPFEAWRLLSEPQGDYWYQTQTYEGNYEWMIHSQAWAENDWKGAEPWNTPTAKTLKPGETYSVGLKFGIADTIQTIENAVVKSDLPLAVGIPGYVVPTDLTARLYLTHSSTVKSIDSHGSFAVDQDTNAKGTPYLLTPTTGTWGRTKITIVYEDGKTQTIHYFITKSAPETVSDLGHFLTTAAHYTDETDPFGRAPSIMGYDREVNAIVDQDERVWIAGLSDEGGTGAYVAAATKLFVQPVEREVAVLDEFIHETVLGTIQPPNSFAVRASAFYYEPGAVNYTYNPDFIWTSWASWNKERAYTTVRAYNYVHPVVAYWSMYRVARDYPQVKTRAPWSWYLNQAYNTVQYCLADGAPSATMAWLA
ncbi:glycoside hydrolase family 43 protein [Colletotrichum tofieldiae]|nr:glycoside hydrolase family 43 protein [Colletotrichum tofieldiae]